MRQKRYWLRGGIIAMIIFFVAVLVVHWSGQIKIINYTVQCLVAPCWDELHVYLFGSNNFLQAPQILSRLRALLIISFTVGAIFGWIYGKIRNKK